MTVDPSVCLSSDTAQNSQLSIVVHRRLMSTIDNYNNFIGLMLLAADAG